MEAAVLEGKRNEERAALALGLSVHEERRSMVAQTADQRNAVFVVEDFVEPEAKPVKEAGEHDHGMSGLK
jgi:hypothetical protein